MTEGGWPLERGSGVLCLQSALRRTVCGRFPFTGPEADHTNLPPLAAFYRIMLCFGRGKDTSALAQEEEGSSYEEWFRQSAVGSLRWSSKSTSVEERPVRRASREQPGPGARGAAPLHDPPPLRYTCGRGEGTGKKGQQAQT